MNLSLQQRHLDAAQLQALCSQQDTLPARTIAALINAGQTVALAESCTGGLCAALLADTPGASAALASSTVVYQTRTKSLLLGIEPAFVERFGPVSTHVTRALALAAREKSETDLGVAITGWAGPSGGTKEDPVGTVYLALAWTSSAVCLYRFHLEGDRQSIRLAAALLAIDEIATWVERAR